MEDVKRKGYLNTDFRIFHLTDHGLGEQGFHYHDFNKILIFLSGNVSYTIEGRTYALSPYDIVLVPAGAVHHPVVRGEDIYERIIIYISREMLESFVENGESLSACFHAESPVLRVESLKQSRLYQCCTELEKSFSEQDTAFMQLNRKVLFLEFLIQLNRAVLAHKITYLETSATHPKLQEILSYINSHLTEDLSADALSAAFYLNRSYLMHLFRKETGFSLGEYVSGKRLTAAREMIAGGTPVSEAWENAGFPSYAAFARARAKSRSV